MKVKISTYNQPITLRTSWDYDSWNRVRAIVYPDGEKVSYHYNKGGLLKSMEGDKNGYTTQYIRDIQYDHYDQRVFMEYGNGVTYNYTYNPETRRLDNLFSESIQQGITLQKNTYKYDNVGNITQIKGYGTDPFEHNYNYDASYRLENANGNGTWQGNNLTYEQSFAYSPSGRIDNKNTTSQKLSNQFGLYNEDYDNTYTYDVNDNPYAVRHITDNTNGLDYDFNWDQKGNMIYHKDINANNERYLCWTEDNRLQAVKDIQMGAYYNYDASGERNLKLTGAVVHMSQNGVPYDYVMLESPTLYASGLITINERGYTKHYFEENKRVCSNIGGGFRDAGYDITEPIGLITSFEEQLGNAKDGIFKTFDQCIKSPVDLENTKDKIVNVMKDHEKDRNEEEYQFYYTNDHLGSSTYITDQDGKITQTLAYLPYGEDWVDLDNQPPYLTPYKFNGKEKDQETGYQYFGARYLNPKLSIWLSVDPMSDKYPHLTSYNYCANNPVMLIDPDGKEIDPASDEQYVKPLEKEAQLRIESINAKMSKLNSGSKKYNNLQNQLNEYNDVLNEISSLRNDKNNLYTIKSGVEGLGKDVNGKVSYGGNSNGMNLINIDLASKADNPAFFLSTIAHELKHAFQFYNQEFGFILTDGIQTNSSMSKELEKKAFIRGDMFSGNTMINNNKFKMNHNLNFEKYSLPNTPNYNLMYDRTSVEEYNHAFGSSFLYNKNKK